jgi:FKBP-type peptidyl-prolyl cis-trans isomerase (trigger factor)
MKRKLLDQLAAGHDFPVPPSMVDAEFQQIWHQLVHETEHEPIRPQRSPSSKPSATIISRSPSAACAWACCSPRSAPPTASR